MRLQIVVSCTLLMALGINAQIPDSTRVIDNGFYLKVQTDSNNILVPLYDSIPAVTEDNFFDSLKVKANRGKISRQLHNLLVIDMPNKNNYLIQGETSRVGYFENFKGKEIRNIVFKQLDVFGPSVYDTSKKTDLWLEKLGNTLHISTLTSSIRSLLFFEVGEDVDPYLFADNERILRTIPNIQDSRIYLLPVEGNPDLVDVQIVTKDVWAIGFSGEVLDYLYGSVSVWHNNMLGLGQQIEYTSYYNNERTPKVGYKIQYKVPNIGNTFTSFSISHKEKWDRLITQTNLKRDFISPSMRLGGGFEYEKNFRQSDLVTIDSVYYNAKTEYEKYDLWGAYSNPIKKYPKQKIRKTYFIAGAWLKYINLLRPDVRENYFYKYHNKKIYLSSVGVTWQGYYNSRLIYGFGKTEDIPYGAMFKITGGYELGEFSDRYYLGGTVSFTKKIKNLGLFSNNIEIGTFIRNQQMEQSLLKYEYLHISPLFGTKRHKFRTFTNLEYFQGFNRFDDEYISLYNNKGVRGLNYSALKGNKKLYVNSELVYYSPQYFYGFRFVYFTFLDMGVIDYKKKALFDNGLFTSLGLGVRIRNERLVFNTVQIRVQFFPFNQGIPNNSIEFIDLSGVPENKMPDFANRKPEIIDYED